MRVMIVVTHLLGTGHLSRAMTLARAFRDAGHSPHVVSGGMPAPHLDQADIPLIQLPPVKSNGTDFTKLLTQHGTVASPDDLSARTKCLLETADALMPDVILTELFPFGRRILRNEFEALLNHMTGRARIVCSVRDILAPPSKPKKAVYAEDIITRFYDAILVHSDPDLAPLSLSWPVTPPIAPLLRYTGFVAPAPPQLFDGQREGILVSTGGGAVGDDVFTAALEAAQHMPGNAWHLVVGGGEERVAHFARNAPPNVKVEGLRPDFRDLMARAAVSVSFAGYNTCMDLLQTGTPAILVPYDDGNEVEQGLRANALASLPAIVTVPLRGVTGVALAQALHEVLEMGPRAARTHNMDGAAASVKVVEEIARDL